MGHVFHEARFYERRPFHAPSEPFLQGVYITVRIWATLRKRAINRVAKSARPQADLLALVQVREKG